LLNCWFPFRVTQRVTQKLPAGERKSTEWLSKILAICSKKGQVITL